MKDFFYNFYFDSLGISHHIHPNSANLPVPPCLPFIPENTPHLRKKIKVSKEANKSKS